MDLFEYADDLRYGELHLQVDSEIDLHAIVAIHNLNRGPAIGGCRFIEYPTTDDALRDAMRLARGMTYKAAITRLPHGGGKAVIVRPPDLTEDQRKKVFEAYGEFVDGFDGSYITCEDSGTTVGDMNVIKQQTDHVLGYASDEGGSGDPSPVTAFGVRRGIEAAVEHRLGRTDLEDLDVAIQGVGTVGYYLAEELHELGANLTVTDVDEEAIERCVEQFGARAVPPDAIYDVDCDVFAPCALGAILNDDTIPRLECDVVAGAANNQLAEPRHGSELLERDILYAPDYAINAGGLINVAQEYTGYDRQEAMSKAEAIYETMAEIFERADSEATSPAVVADRIAEERIYEEE
ncbi:MAG: Glu/Leu/Phe/Val dehydrogenase dimerization domain-containing protein [Bradymonadaceae bacterium]